MGDTTKLGFDSPDISVHSTEQTAPAAGTVLCDSGAVVKAGNYRFRCVVATTDTIQNLIQGAHRNAANRADLELADLQAGPNSQAEVDALFVLAANERVVVRNLIVGTAAKVYQANLYGWLL